MVHCRRIGDQRVLEAAESFSRKYICKFLFFFIKKVRKRTSREMCARPIGFRFMFVRFDHLMAIESESSWKALFVGMVSRLNYKVHLQVLVLKAVYLC